MTKVGIFEELQSDGSVAKSWMRWACTFLILSAIAYLVNQLIVEKIQINYLWHLLATKTIDLQSYLAMKGDVAKVDWVIFNGLLTSGIGGKLIQKFGETKPTNNVE